MSSKSTENGSEPKYRDETWLYEQYVEQRRSTTEIADDCGCDASTVGRWVNRYDIETRGPEGRIEDRVPDERLLNPAWLRERYVEQRQTMREIGKTCGCSGATVENWLGRHDIETRDARRRVPDQRLTDAEWLRKKYSEEHRTLVEIGEDCGCSGSTVAHWLTKHDIEIRSKASSPVPDQRLTDADWVRSQYIDEERTMYEIAAECGCSAHCVGEWLDRHGIQTRPSEPETPDKRLADAAWMQEQYVEKLQSTYDIADKCGCCKSTVSNWLNRHEIDTRDKRISYVSGKDHPNYDRGEIPYGPGWNDSKKRAVRKRDGYSCQDPRCSVTQSEHREQYGEKLHVHHLRKARDVDDAEERNRKENLITLCRNCHRQWEKMADAGLVPQIVR